jgi:hypothetical protein
VGGTRGDWGAFAPSLYAKKGPDSLVKMATNRLRCPKSRE